MLADDKKVIASMAFGLLIAILLGAVLPSGCGQKDPTQALTGMIYVSSDTTGAAIFLDGEDTHQVTPDTLKEVATGRHVIKVRLLEFVSTPESLVVEVSSGELVEALFSLRYMPGSRRLVLLEHFTSVNCGPCPEANEIINGVLEEFGSQKVVGIEYHIWPGDPFYDAASIENITRSNYYSVSIVPDIFVGGLISPTPNDSMAIAGAVEDRLEVSPPVAVTVTDTVVGQSWSGSARLVGLTNMVGDIRGFFVVMEREVYFTEAPGSNGEKDFWYVMRDITPDASGEILSISAGDTVTVPGETDLHPDVDAAQVYAIYFIQDYATQEVLQTGTSLPR